MTTTYASNAAANSAVSYLHRHSADQSSSISKLSSGSRVVRASDDAASLSIGTKMSANLAALKQASVNVSHAESMLQTADGGLAQISDALSRMKALATQANAGTMSSEEVGYIKAEYDQLKSQIDTIAEGTKFNGKNLLTGAMAQTVDKSGGTALTTSGLELQVTASLTQTTNAWTVSAATAASATTFTLSYNGSTVATQVKSWGSAGTHTGVVDFGNGVKVIADEWSATGISSNNTFSVSGSSDAAFQVGLDPSATSDLITVNGTALGNATASGLGVDGTFSAANLDSINTNLDAAIKTVNEQRSEIGSFMSRFETVGANLASTIENLDSARSTMMDVDVAAEMTKFSTTQVQTQAATAMLAQANQLPQNLMRLLQ